MFRIAVAIALTLSLACVRGDDADADGRRADWTTSTDTIGDTVVVRTVGGSDAASLMTLAPEVTIGTTEGADEYTFGAINELEVGPRGTVYVFDRQVPALRAYDSTGAYIRTLGRKGGGPGEYEAANGVAVHRDGRVVLWDAGKASINVYDAAGEPDTTWSVPGGGGFYTSGAVHADTAGNTYIRTTIGNPPSTGNAPQARVFGLSGLVQWNAEGKVVDSLTPPATDVEPVWLMAQSPDKTSTSRTSVPFATSFVWAFSPLGYFVSARTDRYAVTLHHRSGKLTRIEREVPSIRLESDERADVEAITTANMKRTDPGWRWSGPAIPETKPFIRGIVPGDDGRIWVSVAAPGELVPEGERAPPPSVQIGQVQRAPDPKWRQPLVYDVFDPSGRFVGRVAAPPKTTFRAMRGDRIWAVTRDSLDVEQVVRYRVVPGFGGIQP